MSGVKKALPSSGECGLSLSSSHSEIYQLVSVRDDCSYGVIQYHYGDRTRWRYMEEKCDTKATHQNIKHLSDI